MKEQGGKNKENISIFTKPGTCERRKRSKRSLLNTGICIHPDPFTFPASDYREARIWSSYPISGTEFPDFLYHQAPRLSSWQFSTELLHCKYLLLCSYTAPFSLLEAKWSWLENVMVQRSRKSRMVAISHHPCLNLTVPAPLWCSYRLT